jgi:hypothetical protein
MAKHPVTFFVLIYIDGIIKLELGNICLEIHLRFGAVSFGDGEGDK